MQTASKTLIRRFLPIFISIGLMSGPAVATAVVRFDLAREFSKELCEEYLADPRLPDDSVLAEARHILDWITFNHPALRNALAAAPDVATQASLLQLPLGFLLPPEKSGGSSISLRTFRKVVHYHVNANMPWGQRRLTTFSYVGKLSYARKRLLTDWRIDSFRHSAAEVSANFLSLSLTHLRIILDASARLNLPQPNFPRLTANVLLSAKFDEAQQVQYDWTKSFSTEDLASLRRIVESVRDTQVRMFVTRLVHNSLDRIVRHYLDLCLLADQSESTDQFITRFDQIRGPDPLTIQMRDTPEIYRKRLGGSTDTDAPLQLPPPVPPEPTAAFEPDRIVAFLDEATHRRSVDQKTFRDVWHDLQEAVHHTNELLVQVQSSGQTVDWREWQRRARTDGNFARSFARVLGEESGRIARDLRAQEVAIPLFARMREWLDAEADLVSKLNKTQVGRVNLASNDHEVMTATMKHVKLFADLLDQTEFTVQESQKTTFAHSQTLAILTLLTGRVLKAKLDPVAAGENPLALLIEALDNLTTTSTRD